MRDHVMFVCNAMQMFLFDQQEKGAKPGMHLKDSTGPAIEPTRRASVLNQQPTWPSIGCVSIFFTDP